MEHDGNTPAGLRTVVPLNGILVADYSEGDPIPPTKHDRDPKRGPRPKGCYIAVQNHPHGKSVYFKETSVHPTDKLVAVSAAEPNARFGER